MKFTAQQFRTDKQCRRDVLGGTTYGDWNLYRLFQWDIYHYIMMGEIHPVIGAQTLHVIDVTDNLNEIARFHDRYHDYPPERNEGQYALVYLPDEGAAVGVLHADNSHGRYYTADLPIYVGPGADADFSSAFGDMAWAISEAKRQGWTQDDKTIANTIRAAARRDAIGGSWQGNSNRWYFPKQAFSEYSNRSVNEQRGRPSKIENLITDFDGDTRKLQSELASIARESTGKIPRGQLWQPCEDLGCDNEPVCMNCLKCQETHCHCFDNE